MNDTTATILIFAGLGALVAAPYLAEFNSRFQEQVFREKYTKSGVLMDKVVVYIISSVIICWGMFELFIKNS